jgi:hypothetical protein
MENEKDPTYRMYGLALSALRASDIPFMIGGAYALGKHTGIHRDTKDLDVFVLPHHFAAILDLFLGLGYPARLVARHWLGKIVANDGVVDIIFGFRNGVGQVEERWFDHACDDVLFGVPVRFLAIEEMIWSKAFVMERDRYDGADIAHLIRAGASTLDWHRLLDRFGKFWMILLNHLVLFGFIYPSDRSRIPGWLIRELTERWQHSSLIPGPGVCRGTLLSHSQYDFDLVHQGLLDARLQPVGHLLPENILE